MSTVVVVTGAAGFLGSHLSRALIGAGCRVVGIDNLDPFYDRSIKRANLADLDPNVFTLHEVDICDESALREVLMSARPAAVFHLAALAGVRPSLADPARYLRVNAAGTSIVLEAAASCGCTKVVLGSSSSVYGESSRVPFQEDDPADQPISPYAASKRAAELIARSAARLHGLRIACLRFFTAYGPGQRPDLAVHTFMRRLMRDEPIPMFGDGSTSRDYTYVSDIVDGVLAADAALDAMGEGAFRIWNLGGDHPITLRGMIDTIARVTGCSARIDQRPMQPGDVTRTWADLTRSRAELGYAPKVTFEDGVARQWAWMQKLYGDSREDAA